MPIPQSSRAGQSRLQRPVSYHEKYGRPDSSNLKLPAASENPHADISPTRLPVFSKSSVGARSDAPIQRRTLRPPTGYNGAQKTQAVSPSSSTGSQELAASEDTRASAETTSLSDSLDRTEKKGQDNDNSSGLSRVLEKTSHTNEKGVQESKVPTKPPTAARQISSGVQRSQSLRKPTSSTTARSTDHRTHSRHASTTSTIASGRSSRTTSSEIQSKRQEASSGQSSQNARTLRSTSTAQGPRRAASTRIKSEQPNSTAVNSGHIKEPATTNVMRDVSGGPAPQINRPEFSTMQQHFSPRKTTKAATSTFTHPAPANPSAPQGTETTRLQSELLHLTILHESSLRTSAQYTASAHAALERKYNNVAKAHHAMRANERTMQARLNLLALSEWTSGSTSFGLSENIQLLSSILKELPSLTEPGGRFPLLVAVFETWIARVENVWAARDSASDAGDVGDFIDGLGADWDAENAALTRRLTALAREAEMLMPAKDGSSVATLVAGSKKLLRGTLDELVVMARIEKDVMTREKAWVQGRVDRIDFESLV